MAEFCLGTWRYLYKSNEKLAYLEKILYLCGIFFAVKKMNDLRLSVYAVVRAHSKTEY